MGARFRGPALLVPAHKHDALRRHVTHAKNLQRNSIKYVAKRKNHDILCVTEVCEGHVGLEYIPLLDWVRHPQPSVTGVCSPCMRIANLRTAISRALIADDDAESRSQAAI